MREFPSFRELIHTSITSLFFFFFLVRTFRRYFVCKFQLYNTFLSTIVIMLCIRFSDLTHLMAESLYSFIKLSLMSPPAPPSGHHFRSLLTTLFPLPCSKVRCTISVPLLFWSCSSNHVGPHFCPLTSNTPLGTLGEQDPDLGVSRLRGSTVRHGSFSSSTGLELAKRFR